MYAQLLHSSWSDICLDYCSIEVTKQPYFNYLIQLYFLPTKVLFKSYLSSQVCRCDSLLWWP